MEISRERKLLFPSSVVRINYLFSSTRRVFNSSHCEPGYGRCRVDSPGVDERGRTCSIVQVIELCNKISRIFVSG